MVPEGTAVSRLPGVRVTVTDASRLSEAVAVEMEVVETAEAETAAAATAVAATAAVATAAVATAWVAVAAAVDTRVGAAP